MNKRERLEATLNGDTVDRVAISLWRHWPGDNMRPDDLAAALIRFQKEYDWDFIRVMPDNTYSIRDWGVENEWQGSNRGTRAYTERVVNSPEDWLGLKVLDPTVGGLGEHLQVLEAINKEFKEDVPFLPTVFSPLAQASFLSDEQSLTLHMRQNAGQVHHALQTITDTTVRFILECKERGAAGIFYSVLHANYLKMSEAEYEVFGRPYDLQILAVAKNDTWFNMLHVGGSHIMFDLVADYPVQAVNWSDRSAAPNLQAGIKRIKGAASAGVDREALHAETPEIALQQARDALQRTSGKRLILTLNDDMLITTPVGNIHKLRKLVDTFSPAPAE